MISQTDIIKTLVNKNCTDESVLSTALSKDCTPTKLLEKLTETERFDLALDISMKSGLDVIPLWRTWAMRCLQNRNFQGAREKFRHCFPRLRLPGYRVSPGQSGLLAEILRVLAQMEEIQLPLTEKIELIKQRKEPVVIKFEDDDLRSRPTIFAECLYYMKQYGATEVHIKFYVANNLWDLAVKDLVENVKKINIEKFFIGDIVQYATSRGRFEHLIKAFLQLDPNIVDTISYFKALYSFCANNRRYNLLNYIQTTIGDHIAAADTQIRLFFLKRPVKSYRELSSRITNLTSARESYQQYLQVLDNDATVVSSLFGKLPREVVEERIKLINSQTEITRNFSINEVSGCINGIEIPSENNIEKALAVSDEEPDDAPVTLFDRSERRKTFLTALVLIYFDLSCSTYFSKNGLDFAMQLIDDYKLNMMSVFKTAMRIIVEDESCDIIANATIVLERLKEAYALSLNRREQERQQLQLERQKREIKKIVTAKQLSRRTSTQEPLNLVKFKNKNRPPTVTIAAPDSITEKPQQPPVNAPDNLNRNNINRDPRTETSERSSPPQTSASSFATSNSVDGARKICDEVLTDAIKSCREPDYKMELAKLLSSEAKIELYIELGKLSNAQRLAFSMNRPDFVSKIIEQATKLNQSHVKTVCQLWLAKHETNKVSTR